jgi:prepilin peptidase CpaA
MLLPIPHLVPLGAGLAWAAATDLRRRRVPNAVTVFVLVSGLLVRAVDSGAGHRVLATLSGLAAAVVVILALFRPWSVGGVGGGDVKHAAATGAWVGLEKLLWFGLASAVAGGIVAIVCYWAVRAPARAEVRTNLTLAVLHGELPSIPAERRGHLTVPYAVAIAAGAAVALVLAN